MAQVHHYALTIYQHTNPFDSTDPNIGFWVCVQVSPDGQTVLPNSSPTPVPASFNMANPYADMDSAQAAINTFIAQQQAENARAVAPENNAVDSLVFGPVFV